MAAAPPPPPSANLHHGMPVAVFPMGPPPPPPTPKHGSNFNTSGSHSPSMARKSPQPPQSFEPPPLGLRPEIKIPPNPMAALKKVPAPKPKEVDWGEEFRKERSRSKSPMPPSMIESSNANETQLPEPVREFNVQQTSAPSDTVTVDAASPVQSFGSQQTPTIKETNELTQRDQNNNFSNTNYGGNQCSPSLQQQQQHQPQSQQMQQPIQQQQQQRVFSPFATSPQPNLPKPMSPIKLSQSNQEENVPIYVRSSQRAASEKPASPQVYQQPQIPSNSSFQRQASLDHGSTPIYTRSSRNVAASPVAQYNQTSTFQPNTNDTENYPIYVRSFQRQQPPASPAAPKSAQQPLSTAQSTFINEPGRQYYNPNSAGSTASTAQNGNQMPPWMRRTNSKEIPEWANNVDDYSRSAPSNNTSTFGNDYNRATPSQHVNNTSTFGSPSNYQSTATATHQYNNNNANNSTIQYNNTTSFNGGGAAPMVEFIPLCMRHTMCALKFFFMFSFILGTQCPSATRSCTSIAWIQCSTISKHTVTIQSRVSTIIYTSG